MLTSNASENLITDTNLNDSCKYNVEWKKQITNTYDMIPFRKKLNKSK